MSLCCLSLNSLNNNLYKPMSLQSPANLLRIISRLTSPAGTTIDELERLLGITRRTVFYYFELLRNNGFTLLHRGDHYLVGTDSEFISHLVSNVSFTVSEAVYLYRLASGAERSELSEAVRGKLERFYDISTFADKPLHDRLAHNLERLSYAIEHKKAAMLVDYMSAHSRTVQNRLVEPYALSNNDTDVECFEVTTHRNKTFKVARMRDVIVTDHLKWGNEQDHHRPYTDVFNFSGETRHHVVLLLGVLSANLLGEEYPRAASALHRVDDQLWRFETDVTSYVGIGRFAIGLMNDIEVISDDGLRAYLRQSANAILLATSGGE